MTRIEELQQKLAGCWVELGNYRNTERACYHALGYTMGQPNKGLPYLIDQLKAERDAWKSQVEEREKACRMFLTERDAVLANQKLTQDNLDIATAEMCRLSAEVLDVHIKPEMSGLCEHDTMVEEIEKLKAELKKVEAERDAAQAAVVAQKDWVPASELDRANAACAEMRRALVVIKKESDDTWRETEEVGHSEGLYLYGACRTLTNHALSTDCGKGWLNPEVGKQLVEAITRLMPFANAYASHHLRNPEDKLYDRLKLAEMALDAAKKAGLP